MTKILLVGVLALAGMFSIVNAAHASLVAHWGFDEAEGATAFDSVGSVNGTLAGGASFTAAGIMNGAIQITDGYVDMGDNFPSSSTFSIQAWVKTTPGDTTGMVPVAKHWAGVPQGYFLSINNIGDGHTQTNTAGFYSANGPYTTAIGGPPVTDGMWHQLVGVYDNGDTAIYIDGNHAGSGSAGFADNGAHFMIGGIFNYGGAPINSYHGFVDEVAVYDHALSNSEVMTLYENTMNPVPLPSALMLFGSGLAGLAGSRLRKILGSSK